MATGCQGKNQNSDTALPEAAVSSAVAARELAMPVVPDTMTDVNQRLEFVINHYWDSMDWNDAGAINDSAFMEQNFANFAHFLSLADTAVASKGVTRMIDASSVNPEAISAVARIAEHYLYNMDSPMYHPSNYLLFVNHLSAIPALPDVEKHRLAYQRKAILSNREGSRAADFPFDKLTGGSSRLSKVAGKRTILIFYDSDCDVCARIEKMLASSPAINAAIADKLLSIVAIDTFTATKEEWAAKAASLPANWIVGYSPDGAVDSDEIYFLRSTPAIYLLDSDMTVLIKDVDDNTLNQWVSKPPIAGMK